jgi:hypothetical protein
MIAILRLEAIGDNFAASRLSLHRRLRLVSRIPHEMRALAVAPGRPWVAELSRGWQRSFLRGRRDYTLANGAGSRGIFVEYVLHDGRIYDVYELTSWTDTRRYFCRVEAGEILTIEREEVPRWLSGSAANENEDSGSMC